MDRNSLFRWILIAGIVVGSYWWFYGRKANDHPQVVPQETYADAPDFAPDVLDVQPGRAAPAPPPPGEVCSIRGNRFEAELSTRGAGLTHFYLTDANYADPKSHDVSTTPDIERWRNLRTLFRDPTQGRRAHDQANDDRVLWK